ncbi:hypothetical protein QJQ45_017900 [Haematococcus lacustris]|nr:hypothetical protein QJQ45_017900 [Haematococcus lacustris]
MAEGECGMGQSHYSERLAASLGASPTSPTELPALETALATPQQSSMDQQELQGAQHQLAVDQQLLQGAQRQVAVDQQQLQGAQHQLAVDQQQLQGAQHQLSLDQQQLKGAQHQLSLDQQQLKGAQHQLSLDQQQLKGAQHQLALDLQQLQGVKRQLTLDQEQLQGALHQLAVDQQQLQGVKRQLTLDHNVGIFVACAYFRNDRDEYRAMHAMFFPADGVAPMWSETACACVRHMGSKPQQCMCHGASTLSSIPMFGRVTLASDKEEDAECLKLLHARAPHIASSYMTLTMHLLKEYARGCLGWKGKRLTQKKPLLRADILEHLRWEQEMEEDQLAEVGDDEANDITVGFPDILRNLPDPSLLWKALDNASDRLALFQTCISLRDGALRHAQNVTLRMVKSSRLQLVADMLTQAASRTTQPVKICIDGRQGDGRCCRSVIWRSTSTGPWTATTTLVLKVGCAEVVPNTTDLKLSDSVAEQLGRSLPALTQLTVQKVVWELRGLLPCMPLFAQQLTHLSLAGCSLSGDSPALYRSRSTRSSRSMRSSEHGSSTSRGRSSSRHSRHMRDSESSSSERGTLGTPQAPGPAPCSGPAPRGGSEAVPAALQALGSLGDLGAAPSAVRVTQLLQGGGSQGYRASSADARETGRAVAPLLGPASGEAVRPGQVDRQRGPGRVGARAGAQGAMELRGFHWQGQGPGRGPGAIGTGTGGSGQPSSGAGTVWLQARAGAGAGAGPSFLPAAPGRGGSSSPGMVGTERGWVAGGPGPGALPAALAHPAAAAPSSVPESRSATPRLAETRTLGPPQAPASEPPGPSHNHPSSSPLPPADSSSGLPSPAPSQLVPPLAYLPLLTSLQQLALMDHSPPAILQRGPVRAAAAEQRQPQLVSSPLLLSLTALTALRNLTLVVHDGLELRSLTCLQHLLTSLRLGGDVVESASLVPVVASCTLLRHLSWRLVDRPPSGPPAQLSILVTHLTCLTSLEFTPKLEPDNIQLLLAHPNITHLRLTCPGTLPEPLIEMPCSWLSLAFFTKTVPGLSATTGLSEGSTNVNAAAIRWLPLYSLIQPLAILGIELAASHQPSEQLREALHNLLHPTRCQVLTVPGGHFSLLQASGAAWRSVSESSLVMSALAPLLPHVTQLVVSGVSMDHTGAACLGAALGSKLQALTLELCQLHDSFWGVEVWAGLPHLTHLRLASTEYGAVQLEDFRLAMPRVRVAYLTTSVRSQSTILYSAMLNRYSTTSVPQLSAVQAVGAASRVGRTRGWEGPQLPGLGTASSVVGRQMVSSAYLPV